MQYKYPGPYYLQLEDWNPDVFVSSYREQGTGDDRLTGNSSSNIIDGWIGADIMLGGWGQRYLHCGQYWRCGN